MTEKIAHDYKQRLVRLALKPSSGGVFEVRLGGETLHSKAATGQFPEENQIVARVGERLGDAP